MEYLDFELEIGLGRGREYPVSVLHSPGGGEPRETIRFPFDQRGLEQQLLAVELALVRGSSPLSTRRLASAEEGAIEKFGRTLFDAMIAGEIRSCYDASIRAAERQHKGLRLKFRIQPPALAALPWEFLYDQRQGEYLCLSRRTPLVRYLAPPHEPTTRTLRVAPLRILGVIANPRDLPPLNIVEEKQRLEGALEDLRCRSLVELTWMTGETADDLQEAMWNGPWHVIHFVGHGRFDPVRDEGVIALGDHVGNESDLTATMLGRRLAGHDSLRLVVLNACEGARGGKRDLFSSTATRLVQQGIPAVVAMQYEILDTTAVRFGATFYAAVATGMAVDAAVAEARIAVSLGQAAQWGTPVLYMRTPDGRVFDVDRSVASQAVEVLPPPREPEPQPLADTRRHRPAAGRARRLLAPLAAPSRRWLVAALGLGTLTWFRLQVPPLGTEIAGQSVVGTTLAAFPAQALAMDCGGAVDPSPPAVAVAAPNATLQQDIDRVLRELPAGASAMFINLSGPERAERDPRTRASAASTIKLPLMVEVLRQARVGTLDLNKKQVVSQQTGGTGILDAHLGASLSTRELLQIMVLYSDNNAGNMLMDLVGSTNVGKTMQQLGFTDTRLGRHFMDYSLPPEFDNVTSVGDMANMLQQIYQRRLLPDPHDDAEMLRILRCRGENRDQYPRLHGPPAKP